MKTSSISERFASALSYDRYLPTSTEEQCRWTQVYDIAHLTTGIIAPEKDELDATLGDWLNEVDRVQPDASPGAAASSKVPGLNQTGISGIEPSFCFWITRMALE
jgi:hypothetical protein